MEAFTELKPENLLARPLTMKTYTDNAAIEEEKIKAYFRFKELLETFETHRNTEESSVQGKIKAQRMHIAKTGVVWYNFHVAEYVLVHRNKPCRHELITGCIEPWWIVDG